jgi:hypothetical protein
MKLARHVAAAAMVDWRWAVFDASIVHTSVITYMRWLRPWTPFSTALTVVPHRLVPWMIALID